MDAHAPSPAPSSYADPTDYADLISSDSGSPRKRPRTDMSVDERKEARAHRNRIAAQNSRDRRKAQFSFLERRVAELEEENRQLRAGMGNGGLPAVPTRVAEEVERQRAQQKENEELKERIRTLERGWEAVMKALATHGFAPQATETSSTQPQPPQSSSSSATAPPPVVPTNSESINTSFPLSPAPSHTSQLEFDSMDSSNSSTGGTSLQLELAEPTRHLARMATIGAGGLAALSFPSLPSQDRQAPLDDATMESLFAEILATSPALETHSLPALDSAPASSSASAPSSTSEEMTTARERRVDVDDAANAGLAWVNDVEMHKLLESLQHEDLSTTALPDLDLGWDLAVGVF